MYFIVLLFVFLALMGMHSIFYGEEGTKKLSSLIHKLKDSMLSLPFISRAKKVAESSTPHGDDPKENDFINQKILPCIKHNQQLNLNKAMYDNKPVKRFKTKDPNLSQKIYKKAVKSDDLNKNAESKYIKNPNIYVDKCQKKDRST